MFDGANAAVVSRGARSNHILAAQFTRGEYWNSTVIHDRLNLLKLRGGGL